MRLTPLPGNRAADTLVASLGSDPTTLSGTADLLRAEVSARGSCLRSATIARVVRFVEPAVALQRDTVAEVCEGLERAGDFQAGDGGWLFATPVRAIPVGSSTLRVVSSSPTSALKALLAGTWAGDGISRSCQVSGVDENGLRQLLAAFGGVVLTPEEWAGFSRTPPADKGWLGGLDRRLQSIPEPAGSLDRDHPLSWAGLVASGDGARWTSGEAASSATLWRARNRWGYWLYAWTGKGSPASVSFVSIRGDEGARTAFALASVLGTPFTADVERRAQDVVIGLPTWVPSAEYRYLAISGKSLPSERNRWSFPVERAISVTDTLRERLGVVIREVVAR